MLNSHCQILSIHYNKKKEYYKIQTRQSISSSIRMQQKPTSSQQKSQFQSQSSPQIITPDQFALLQKQNQRKENNVLIMKMLEKMDKLERMEWIELKRLKGKELYQRGKFAQAIQVYMQGLLGIWQSDSQSSQPSSPSSPLSLKTALLLNISTCLYRQDNLSRALSIINRILQFNPNHYGTLYKKIHIMYKMGEIQGAFGELERVIQGIEGKKGKEGNGEDGKQQDAGDGRSKEEILREFGQLRKQICKANKQNKNIYAKMFNQYSQSQNQSEKLLESTLSTQASTSSKISASSSSSQSLLPQPQTESQQQILYHQDELSICNRLFLIIKRSYGALCRVVGMESQNGRDKGKEKEKGNREIYDKN